MGDHRTNGQNQFTAFPLYVEICGLEGDNLGTFEAIKT